MRQDDNVSVLPLLLEVVGKPLQLLIAKRRARVRDVVERDEMHALVVERVARLAEEFLERLAAVERRVMLARHEMDVLDLELADDFLELRESPAPFLRIIGRMCEISGEHDEIRLFI